MTFLADKISAVEPTEWDAEIAAKMQTAGFALENMGGNTQAWKRPVGDDGYALVSYSDGFAFGNPADGAWCAGHYRIFDNPSGDPEEMADLLDLQQAIDRAASFK